MVLTATITHCTTCLRPLARLMARRGRSTRRTRRIFTTDIAPELKVVQRLILCVEVIMQSIWRSLEGFLTSARWRKKLLISSRSFSKICNWSFKSLQIMNQGWGIYTFGWFIPSLKYRSFVRHRHESSKLSIGWRIIQFVWTVLFKMDESASMQISYNIQ